MNTKDFINNYLYFIKIYKTKNLDSLYKETRQVINLERCLNKYNEIIEFNKELFHHVIDWFRSYTKSKNATINKNIKLLERIFKFNNLAINHNMKKLPDDTVHFQPIEENDLKLILNYILDMDLTYKNNQVYQLAILMLLDTGCRMSELVRIKIDNINFSNNSIFLDYTKNNENAFVLFTKFTREKILNLVERNKKENIKYLFYNYDKKKNMTSDHVDYFIRFLKKKLKLKHLHAHQFRKTLATTLHDNGVDIKVIKEILRHKTLEMTNIYVNCSLNNIKNKYDEASTWYDAQIKKTTN